MATFRIPDDLVSLVAERRLIPFVGAGFSAVHGLPTWDSLLREVAAEVQAGAENQPQLSYEAIKKSCERDNLRIAEYLYLMSGGSIGPVRHSISNAMRIDKNLVNSTPHVELVNLGAPQVYTTNFEDLIERTYRELGLAVDVVALPRDVARSHADRTQVVKYHGDLRHDDTLVLTESQYYKRLEFESPMDLKFRSDLLGKSVLFVGYSFSDVNIRVIWYKLMQMMEDVPQKDRPPSYIVRLHPNRVLDTLYEAVGLKTIVIDPDQEADSDLEQGQLLSEFMLELSMRAATMRGGGALESGGFVSPGLLAAVDAQLEDPPGPTVRGRSRRRYAVLPRSGLAGGRLGTVVSHFNKRGIPPELLDSARDTFDRLARHAATGTHSDVIELAIRFASGHGGSSGATFVIANALMSENPRKRLLGANLDWDAVWRHQLNADDLEALVDVIEAEVDGQLDDDPYRDHDLAYAIDIAKRIIEQDLGDGSDESNEEVARARELISRIVELYPAANNYSPSVGGQPDPVEIVEEINAQFAREAAADKAAGQASDGVLPE